MGGSNAIAASGVSVETVAEALEAIARPNVASVQLIVNVFRQEPLERVLPAAAAAGVGVVARVPLGSGSLTGPDGVAVGAGSARGRDGDPGGAQHRAGARQRPATVLPPLEPALHTALRELYDERIRDHVHGRG